MPRSLSSTSSTIDLTWRSLLAEQSRNASVITSCSETSNASRLEASLSEAALAAVVTSSMARSVALMQGPRRSASEASGWVGCCSCGVLGGIEVVLGDVLHNAVWHEVPDRLAGDAAFAAVAGGDGQRRDLDQRESLGRDAREQARVSLVARPGAADEMGQLEEPLGVAPGEDLAEGVGAGDEEQLGVGVDGGEVAQRVDRVRRAAAVDVDPR